MELWSVILAAGLVPVVWLGSRVASGFLVATLASLAFGLIWYTGTPQLERWTARLATAQTMLLVAAVLANGRRFGIRTSLRPWPWLGGAVLLLISMLQPPVDPLALAAAAGLLVLPWSFVHVRFDPDRRNAYAMTIAALPGLSLAAGVATDRLGLNAHHYMVTEHLFRLQGATNAGWLGFLSFTAVLVSLHEAVRQDRPALLGLTLLNGIVLLLSGGRMAALAAAVALAAYILSTRTVWRDPRFARPLLGVLALGAAAFVIVLPALISRSTGDWALSGRSELWERYWSEFLAAPWFGHGLAVLADVAYPDLPHNDYLRLLVVGGVVGFAVYGATVALWFVQLHRRLRADEAVFLRASMLGLALYALTDNVLTMTPALALYAYLGVITASGLIKPARNRPPRRTTHPASVAVARPRRDRQASWLRSEPGSIAPTRRRPTAAATGPCECPGHVF